MMRFVYSLLFYLTTPIVCLRLLWRSRRQPEYLRHLGERYALYGASSVPQPAPLIWLHAVSVGETRAAAPLIESLMREYPDHQLLLTHMTPTGRAAGRDLAQRFQGRLQQAYLPYDLPDACGRFFERYGPTFGLLMETELWPNLIAAAGQHGIPLALVNARLSNRSARGYRRLDGLIRPALAALDLVAAQTVADAERLTDLGATKVVVCGNLKFDVAPDEAKLQMGMAWKRALGSRPVLLAASTREGEEAIILDAMARIRVPGLLLLLVPRHPQRFDEVATLIEGRGMALCRRSSESLPTDAAQVWLGDSMGEMVAYYAAADLALIGGSLLPFGGQNLIEAAVCGCPVLVGPHTYNFAQAAGDAVACGAARRVEDAQEASRETETLLGDPGRLDAMRQAAIDFSRAHRGATQRIVAAIRQISWEQTGR